MRCKDERVIDEGGGGPKVRVSLRGGRAGGGGGLRWTYIFTTTFF